MSHRRSSAVHPPAPLLDDGTTDSIAALHRQEAELRRTNRALRTISVCNQTLVRATNEADLLHDICELIVREGGYRMAWIGFAEDDPEKTVRPVAQAGAEAGYLALAHISWADNERRHGPTGNAIRTGRPFVCRDMQTDPAFAPWRDEARKRGYASSLVLPLQIEDRVVGTLSIYSAVTGVFDADEVRLLCDLAADLAYGINALRTRRAREQMDDALRYSEKSLREAQRVARMGNWDHDLVRNILWWSDEIYGIFELDPKKFGASYEAFLNLVHPDDRQQVNRAYTDSVRNRVPYDIVHRLLLPDGRIKHVLERCDTLYDRAGRPLRSLGTIQDITERMRTEETLRQASAYHRRLIEASLDPLVVIGPDGKITDVNTATETATGRPRTELIGTDFSVYFTEPEQARAGYQRAFREGSVHDYPLELRHRAGHITSVLYNASVYRDEQGRVTGVFAAARDVTARNRAEELQARLAAIVDSANDAIVSKGLDGIVLTWNPAAERLFGYEAAEIIGRHISLLMPKEREAEESEILARIRRGELLQHYESVRLRKDGTAIAVSLTVSPIRDGKGRVTAASTIVRDITEHQKAQQALLEAGAYNRSLIEASLDPMVTIGPDGKIMDVNAATEAVTGRPRAELIGTDFSVYFTEPENARAGYRQVFRDGLVRDYPLELRHSDGHVTSVLYNASVYRDDRGRVIGVFAAARDITERKRAEEEIHKLNASLDRRVRERTEELEAANRELESFSYSVSHDLRAPLRSIDGFSRILQEDYHDKLDDEAKDSLARVRAATQRMDRLIDDLLKLSRATRTEMRREAVDLTALAGEVAAELQQAEPARQVRWTIAPGLTATGDRQLIRVVLDNLLGNAWKFTGRRSDAWIEMGEAATPEGPAIFVRDNGVGFDMAYAGKLFGAFQRLHSTADFPGTGIGLATVQRIIHRHRGRVWTESAVGQGATFYFTLPATPP